MVIDTVPVLDRGFPGSSVVKSLPAIARDLGDVGSILGLGADDTTLMAESEEELKSLMRVKKENEEAGLKLSFQKMKIMASGPIR